MKAVVITVATLCLLAIALLKIVSVLQAITWVRRHGARYISSLRTNPPGSECDYWQALRQAHGAWFPFGVKDFVLRDFIAHCRLKKTIWSRLAGICAAGFQCTLYRFQRFAGIVGIYAVAIASFSPKTNPLSSIDANLLYMLVVVVLATNALLSVEAVCCYAIFGNYAMSFHMLSPENHTWGAGDRLLLELKVIAGKVITTLYCGTVAAFVTRALFGGFQGNSLPEVPHAGLGAISSAFFQMTYFTTTTFVTVGFGDITPANIRGQFVALLIEIQAFSIVGLVLASMLATKDAAAPGQRTE
jgi:hypothetical protein